MDIREGIDLSSHKGDASKVGRCIGECNEGVKEDRACETRRRLEIYAMVRCAM